MNNMRNRLLLGSVAIGLLMLASGPVWSGGEKQPDFKKMMEMYGVPGPEHKNLEPLHGKFDVSVKMFMPGKKEPNTSKGAAERKWVMDKRYLHETVSGEFMGGQFKGQGFNGFDRFKKKYVFTWMDNMGTGILYAEGTYDPDKKTFTYNYVEDSPFTGKGTKARDVVKIVSMNEHVMESYRTLAKGGPEFKMMEITYTRQGKKVE
jgi:hypothetical protein